MGYNEVSKLIKYTIQAHNTFPSVVCVINTHFSGITSYIVCVHVCVLGGVVVLRLVLYNYMYSPLRSACVVYNTHRLEISSLIFISCRGADWDSDVNSTTKPDPTAQYSVHLSSIQSPSHGVTHKFQPS